MRCRHSSTLLTLSPLVLVSVTALRFYYKPLLEGNWSSTVFVGFHLLLHQPQLRRSNPTRILYKLSAFTLKSPLKNTLFSISGA